jgi:colanic acid/amylovoran biosynthesis protein
MTTSHWRFETPLEIIKQIASCRLVVTGAFHTAVFALSQGIPAVGLAKSIMYIDKFKSLVDQFGSGCQVICIDTPDLSERLTNAIDEAWDSAEQVRPGLLEAAAWQIELGHAAYRRLYELVESRRQDSAMERPAHEYA